MKTRKYIYWFDGHFWNGYLEDYPDNPMQADSQSKLKEKLRSVYQHTNSDFIKNIKYMDELEV